MRFGPVVFTGPLMLMASPTGSVVGNPVEIKLAIGRQRAGVVIIGQEGQLRRIESQVVEDVGFGRIEHAESASHHGVPLHRPGQADARRPIVLVELHAGVRHRILAIGRDHDGAIQVEVADATIGGRSDVVANSKIDGQVGANPEIILHECAQIPIARGIETLEKILFVGIRDAEQEVSQPVAAIRRAEVVGVHAAEVEKSARRCDLVEIALLPAEVDAEFQRVPSPDPGECVRNLINVFKGVFGQEQRIAQRGEAGDINIGQSGRIGISGAVGIGNSQLVGTDGRAEVEGQRVDGITEISAVKIVQQLRRESVGEAQAEVLGARVAGAGTTIGPAPQWTQRAGPLAAHVAKAVRREHLVLHHGSGDRT